MSSSSGRNTYVLTQNERRGERGRLREANLAEIELRLFGKEKGASTSPLLPLFSLSAEEGCFIFIRESDDLFLPPFTLGESTNSETICFRTEDETFSRPWLARSPFLSFHHPSYFSSSSYHSKREERGQRTEHNWLRVDKHRRNEKEEEEGLVVGLSSQAKAKRRE